MPDPVELREIPVSEAPLVDELVSNAFGYQAPHHFFQDFPVWGSDQVRRFGLFKGSKLVSHVGIRIASIGASRIGLIGAVSTHALHRGEGLSSQLLEHVIKVGERGWLDWLVLWGSEHDFYGKFGFDLAGVQARVQIGELSEILPATEAAVREGYTPKIFDAIRSRTTPDSLVLKYEDRDWFEKHETVRWLWTEQPFAFAGFERGMDLPNLVHEWGGDPAGLRAILEHISAAAPSAELLAHPSQLAALSGEKRLEWVEEWLCLARSLQEPKEWPREYWISGLNAC